MLNHLLDSVKFRPHRCVSGFLFISHVCLSRFLVHAQLSDYPADLETSHCICSRSLASLPSLVTRSIPPLPSSPSHLIKKYCLRMPQKNRMFILQHPMSSPISLLCLLPASQHISLSTSWFLLNPLSPFSAVAYARA